MIPSYKALQWMQGEHAKDWAFLNSLKGQKSRQVTKFVNTTRRGPVSFKVKALREAAKGGRATQERKWFDLDLQGFGLNITGGVAFLNDMGTGTDGTQRIGDRIKMWSLQWRGQLQPTGNTATASVDMLRFLIVYDKQPTPGSTPSISTILANGTGTTSSSAFVNMDNRDRFVILHDDTWVISNPTASFTGSSIVGPQYLIPSVPTVVQGYKKLKGAEAVFERGSNNIHSGALYAVTIGTHTAGAEAMQLNLAFRLRFTD